MIKMKAGILRHAITIENESVSQDEFGNSIVEWVKLKDTRASINPIAGNELVINNQIVNDIDNEIFIRYVKDLTPSARIIYKERVFNIKRILDFEFLGVWMQILAKEDLSVTKVPTP